LTGGAFAAAAIHVSASIMLGFAGIRASVKGARSGVHAARVRSGHVGPGEHRAHEILAEAGPHAALLLVRCSEPEVAQTVLGAVADRARFSWEGALDEFLAGLDPGPEHD